MSLDGTSTKINRFSKLSKGKLYIYIQMFFFRRRATNEKFAVRQQPNTFQWDQYLLIQMAKLYCFVHVEQLAGVW